MQEQASSVRTFVFFPEGAYGPTNNCVGIGQVLQERGHRVVFVIEESFAGSLDAQGFEERLIRLGPPPETEEAPGQFWKDFIRDTAPVFRKPTIEQLEGFVEPTFRALCDGARYADDRLREIFGELESDVIVEDNVVAFPAIQHAGRPWTRIASCNPLELRDRAIPPVFSGYSSSDTAGWAAFGDEYARVHGSLHAEFSAFCVDRGATPLRDGEFMHESPWLNIYLYPAEVDYQRSAPLAPTWHRIESSVRRQTGHVELPDGIAAGTGRLIYLSLGSLGSADVALMRRLVEVLSRSPNRFIVSKGPQHEEYDLAANMWGAEFLPQPALMPLVDLVITHAGNNTTTECFHFGKPMVALPLFWDQYDNAQRIDETGFGTRLPTYSFEDHEVLDAVERLLADTALHARMSAISTRVQEAAGPHRAATLLERLAATVRPVSR